MGEPNPPEGPKAANRGAKPIVRDPSVHLLIAAPVFLLYQVGLLISPNAANGVDLFTRSLGYLAGLSAPVYLAVVVGLVLTYGLVLRSLIRKHRFDLKKFYMVLLESAVYALVMGPVAGRLLSELHVLGAKLAGMGILDRIVASAGAGFYEELVFRLGLMAGIIWLLDRKGLNRFLAVFISLVASSLIFSAVHYVGPGSDPFGFSSFAYRSVLGAFLGLMFVLRGFGTAVWAHFLYDVWVMVVLME